MALDEMSGSVVARQRLEPHPSSVSRARRLVTRALGDLGRDELADAAALAVSELVTNALVHAGTPMEVVVTQRETDVVVEVVDDSPRLPFRRHNAEMAGTGRGLHLVEQLTTAWGAQERPPGKAVWFLLREQPVGAGVAGGGSTGPDVQPDLPPDLPADLDPDAELDALLAAFPEEAPPPAQDEVVLLDVPLLLHAAWQQQAESLLREYLLTRLSGDDDRVEAELGTHASVHEAVVLLQEHLPAPELGDEPEALMAAAVEPLVSADQVVLPVPAAAADSFERLDTMLDAVMELADVGALLTPPTQPEVREFRRWVCREVRDQLAGAAAPRSWSGHLRGRPALGGAAPPSWDSADVATATQALVAAGDTNSILAASPRAVRLLGYESAAELTGRRLLDIIPERFHQAHLAGVTLHAFVGRSPLLGQPVVVPALRRDGTEVPVHLLVEVVSLPGGRHVFIAEMSEAGPASPAATPD